MLKEDLKEGKESKSRKNKQEEVMRWNTSKVAIVMMMMTMLKMKMMMMMQVREDMCLVHEAYQYFRCNLNSLESRL